MKTQTSYCLSRDKIKTLSMKSELELLSLFIFNSTDYLVSFFNDCNGSRQKEWTKRSVESVHDFEY